MTTRRQPVWTAALFACLGLVGCNTLKFSPLAPEKLVRTDREQAPLPPGKCALRVSQFVFLSDFELQRDAPLFQELAQLRDQLYKDLQLPPSHTLVQVFLFEDRE